MNATEKLPEKAPGNVERESGIEAAESALERQMAATEGMVNREQAQAEHAAAEGLEALKGAGVSGQDLEEGERAAGDYLKGAAGAREEFKSERSRIEPGGETAPGLEGAFDEFERFVEGLSQEGSNLSTGRALVAKAERLKGMEGFTEENASRLLVTLQEYRPPLGQVHDVSSLMRLERLKDELIKMAGATNIDDRKKTAPAEGKEASVSETGQRPPAVSASEIGQRPEESESLFSAELQGVGIIFRRTEEELKRKWGQRKKHFGVRMISGKKGNQERFASFLDRTRDIFVDVVPNGTLRVAGDGNTRMYFAVKLGISPERIPILMYVPGSKERKEGSLQDALDAAKKYQEQKERAA